jgi:hypothetical protein
LEPFADGLFARHGTNTWQVYCIDIQDDYFPKIELVQFAGKVRIFRDGENRGEFDLADGTFRRSERHPKVEPEALTYGTNPPGEWRLRSL